jgi:hypothetical protein
MTVLRVGESCKLVTFYIVLVDNETTVLPNAHVFRSRAEADRFRTFHADARIVEKQGWA